MSSCFKIGILFSLCISLSFSNYMDDIAEEFDNLTEKYSDINEDVQSRLDDEISDDAKQVAGDKRVNVYLTEAMIAKVDANTREATKTLTKDLGTTIANLTELSSQIQEIELLIAEAMIAQNDFLNKKEIAKTIKKELK